MRGLDSKASRCRDFKRFDKRWAWREAEYLIDNIPDEIWGDVVGDSVTNWVYQQGFFAALMRCYAPNKSLRIVDFGCGHGKLAPVSVFFTHPEGEYLGIDIQRDYIEYCAQKYTKIPRVRFQLSRDVNPFYPTNRKGSAAKKASYGEDWNLTADSVDVVIAVSVFTHLQEADALGYARKIYSILKPSGLAILTCHIVEEPRKEPGFIFNYDPVVVGLFKFSTPLPGTGNWFTCCPEMPEAGIAMNIAGLNSLIQGKFKTELILRGSCTGGGGPLPQDVAVLKKMV